MIQPLGEKTRGASYRPDIDGLRAIAVSSVLLFHLDVEMFSGGFVGVDVFFVISGFLISRLIKDEVEKKKFSFSNFYVRRARRLFPALFFTFVVSFVFALLMFSPQHFERFGGSLLHAAISLSNFYLWSESGYFDLESSVKPLLHTWSLSVEEQFYLFWPIVLVTLLRTGFKYGVPIFLMISGAFSLYLNQVFLDGRVSFISDLSSTVAEWIKEGPATIFYLAPFRVFEFAIGASLVWFVHTQPKSRIVSDVIFLTGLVFIAISVVFYTKETLFPSYYALLPCVGAALVIYSGGNAVFSSKLLNNKVAVNIGLISYSLYLAYWPLIVFYKYYLYDELVARDKIIIVVASFVIAYMMYYFIEQPFRRPRYTGGAQSKGAVGFICVSLTLLVVVLGAYVWVNSGWKWRVSRGADLGDVYGLDEHAKKNVLHDHYKKINRWSAVLDFGDKKDILIIGDSHASQYYWMANYLYEKYGLGTTIFSSSGGCPPIFNTYNLYDVPEAIKNEPEIQLACKRQTRIWEEFVEENAMRYEYVILSARWDLMFERGIYFKKRPPHHLLVDKDDPKFSVADSKRTFKKRLAETIDKIKKLGLTPIVFGQVADHEIPLWKCDNFQLILYSEKGLTKRCAIVPKSLVLKRLAWVTNTIREIASSSNVATMFPTDFLCDNEGEYCRTHYEGARLYNDGNHVNKGGALYLAYRWSISDIFPFR
ncbi:acyltransferase family protein [Candidatus Thiosymbion oneisti]|uniref:acyltransferase family protein n=1 Tax=Candidatus Thiosymbion oneisti TaxID=589554 RepID=UPI000A8D0313|nr:acyltransferase family protein [Candidatus Thiosymbion oneisti]